MKDRLTNEDYEFDGYRYNPMYSLPGNGWAWIVAGILIVLRIIYELAGRK